MKNKVLVSFLLSLLLVFQLAPLAYADDLLGSADATDEQAASAPAPDLPGGESNPPATNPGGGIAEADPALDGGAAAQSTAAATLTPLEAGGSAEVSPLADGTFTVTLKITGLKIASDFLSLEKDEWVNESITVDEATDALKATTEYLDAHADHFTDYAENWGFISSITRDGVTLGQGSSSSGYSYWVFYVDDEYWGDLAPVPSHDGEVWEWRYSDGAGTAFADSAITIKITGVDNVGGTNVYVPWLAATKYYSTSVNCLEATCAVLDRAGLSYDAPDTGWGPYLDAITKDGVTLAGASTATGYAYWEFFEDGSSSWNGAYATMPLAGSVYEFRYTIVGDDAPVEVIVDPNAPRPDYKADNAGFAENTVIESLTPYEKATTELAFKNTLKDGDDWYTNVSDVLIVNGNVYMAVGQMLVVYDGLTGAKLAEAQLANSIGFVSRPVYTDGIIVVPLAGGRLQAFTADTLACVWITDVLPGTALGAHQSNSTLIARDGYLYFGTSIADWVASYAGTFLCIDAADGSVSWQYENTISGYYWAGAVAVGDYIYVADDAGNLCSFYKTSSYVNDTVNLGAGVRSTLTSDGTYLYCADTSGRLWRVKMGEWGALVQPGPDDSLSFAMTSTSSPVISDGKLYIGGTAADYSGVFVIIDLASFTIEKTVSAPGAVQSIPLVVKQANKTYVYITANAEPGGVLCYDVSTGTLTEIFTPTGDDANWCMYSIVASSKGFLYYTNDSGVLFALKVGVGGDDPTTNSNPGGNTTNPTGSTGRRVVVVSIDATTDNTTNPNSTTTTQTTNADAPTAANTTDIPGSTTPLTSTGTDTGEQAVGSGLDDAALTSGSTLPIIPMVGIGVGASGLLAALIWFIKSRGVRVGKEA